MKTTSRVRTQPAKFAEYVAVPSTSEEEVTPAIEDEDPEEYEPLAGIRAAFNFASVRQSPASNSQAENRPLSPGLPMGSNTGDLSPELFGPTASTSTNENRSGAQAVNTAVATHTVQFANSIGPRVEPIPGNFQSWNNGPHLQATAPQQLLQPCFVYGRRYEDFMTDLNSSVRTQMTHVLKKDRREQQKKIHKPQFLPLRTIQDIDALEQITPENFEHLCDYLKFRCGKNQKPSSIAATLFRETLLPGPELVKSLTITKTLEGKKCLLETKFIDALMTTMKLLRDDLEEMAKTELCSVLTKGLKSLKNCKKWNSH